MFHESFMEEEISRIFQGCFMIKGVSRVFQGRFKETFKVFPKSFMCMALIVASRAEGGLVVILVGYKSRKSVFCLFTKKA